ncbi:MAG: ATP-binding cassette domain-containing protein, partial [Cyclobacteriaceae bacterium]|nr:ATP-binding cassette domain-containing protein [Cyclobacteriaceae bacterium]
MSEPVLKAIMKLFALVAKEDTVTNQERDYIQAFLADHVGKKSTESHLHLFDEYARETSEKLTSGSQEDSILKICASINEEMAQKQKIVIMLELISLIMADGVISSAEDKISKTIGKAFNIASDDIELIKQFIEVKKPEDYDSENVLVVCSNSIGKSRTKVITRPELDGFITILYIRTTDVLFFRYLGNSDMYLNGIPQKSGLINVLGTGSILRWGITDPVYYGQVINIFKKQSVGTRTSFEADKISYEFKNGKLGLRDVMISEESGNLVALMGASGAGKSTLLHVLNGTEKPSKGRVLINGIDIHKNPEQIEGVIGFVPQDDLLIEDLTVYQNLYFAAKLCFSHLNEEEIDLLVIKTL